MKESRILVTGGNGFVARALTRHLLARNQWVLSLPKEALNIGDEAQVREALAKYKPDVLLNAAGTKDLQGCEDDSQWAMRLNAFAAAMLASVCGEMRVKFVHIGSDHAFSTPLTAYGESKRAGQEMVLHANPAALVAVTGHVFDVDCPWILWLRAELEAQRKVECWADLYNNPTYAGNLADMILSLLRRGAAGVFDCVGAWRVNRYELFKTYAEIAGLDPSLLVVRVGECPSRLHPRRIPLPSFAWGGKPMGLVDAMNLMCGTNRGASLEGVAA